jgi:hypothetical protein
MTRESHRRAWVAAFSIVAAGAPLATSCAEAEATPPNGDDVSTDGGPDREAPTSDAELDGGRPPVVGCEATAWCPVTTTGIDPRRTLGAIWGSAKDDVWVVGSVGTIAHFDGTAWTTVPSGTKETLRAVWGSSAADVWAVSTPGTLLHSAGWQSGGTFDRGPEVPRVVNNVFSLTLAVWGTSPDDVWLGGEPIPLDWDLFEHAPAWRKAAPDAGAAWENVFVARSTDRVTVRSFWGSGPSDVWAVGGDDEEIANTDGTLSVVSSGRTFHARAGDAGPTSLAWSERDSQANAVLHAVWGTAGGDVWAVGRRGTIRRFRPGASRWEVIASPTAATLHGLWGSGPNDIWAVGDSGTLLHFDGTTWKTSSAAFASGTKPNLYGVWGSSATDIWAVGEAGLLRFTGHVDGGAP